MGFYVGITGNIASGKSTVAKAFAAKGIALISADQISRDLTKPHTAAYTEIVNHFGKSILLKDGHLDRKKLREFIFKDPQERLWLENLLHPLIRKQIKKELKKSTSPYTMIEIPLLKSREHYPFLNRILTIITPKALQIQRILERDNCPLEQAEAILATQPDLIERVKIADDLLFNDSDLAHMQKQVDTLHSEYMQYAS